MWRAQNFQNVLAFVVFFQVFENLALRHKLLKRPARIVLKVRQLGTPVSDMCASPLCEIFQFLRIIVLDLALVGGT